MNPILFSHRTNHWNTPTTLYKSLNIEFNFDFDPCPSNPDSYNGLIIEWKQKNYINPPYSEVSKWIKKGYEESLKNKLCVFLVASRTDTKWFHEYALRYATEIRFIKGRLHFNEAKSPAPFPSCIIIFDGRKQPHDKYEEVI